MMLQLSKILLPFKKTRHQNEILLLLKHCVRLLRHKVESYEGRTVTPINNENDVVRTDPSHTIIIDLCILLPKTKCFRL
jgi:hypothetical protein